MPAVTLTAAGGGAPDDSEDDATYIEYVFLSKSSLTMMPNTSYTLVADIDPVDVTYPTLTWSSSDNSVAEVDQDGNVTAKSDGNVTITALAVGGVGKSCSVTVKTPKTFASGDYVDYVDESGVNHGKGVAVAGVIWAPVNCGYEPATADYKGYPYGKLYQWGRKHGQGYNSNDASYPSGENLVEGPVMPSWGSSDTYKDAFFYNSYDWCNTQIDDPWVDSEGKKTGKDPCPTGWRVPTYAELSALCKNYSWLTKDNHAGCYFVGEYTYIEGLPQVFFPAAGHRDFDGFARYRGYGGQYWSSRPSSAGAYYASYLDFDSRGANMSSFCQRAYGDSVRCVQE
ncbi:MAG: Ig-like domain-containing protein [Bacteroidales bacterium]|nr:Ig-like domain-containing protein [Bacteroidales bacterium]